MALATGTDFLSRKKLSAGKVWVVHPLSKTASLDGSIEKDEEKSEKGEKIEEHRSELFNFELTNGVEPSSMRNHFSL